MARVRPIVSRIRDFQRGVVGGIVVRNRTASEHRFVRLANNAIMRPAGAASARGGSQRLTSATLADIAHSLGEWIPDTAEPKLYAAFKTYGAFTGSVKSIGPTSTGGQTWPYTPSDQWMTFAQLNNVMWATQYAGTEKPAFMSTSNAADTWLTAVLPKPGSAPTLSSTLLVHTGGLTPGQDYWWRVRWRYNNGSSVESAVSASKQVTAGNEGVKVQNLDPSSARSDYVGWTLERTKSGATQEGPFYWVAEGTGDEYDDTNADAALFDLIDENLHGEPQHMDGILAFKDRLFGWSGSHLYCSQSVDDLQDSGLCNWDARNDYTFGLDDGDDIQCCRVQQDRLVVLKKWSIWTLEGDDPSTFKIVPIHSGVGASGPRAAVMSGRRGWFFSSGSSDQDTVGLHLIDGNTIRPAGWIEVGHYINTIPRSGAALVEAVDFFSQYAFVSYPVNNQFVEEQIVYDQRFDNWTHFTGWRMTGAMTPKSTLYDNARLIWCDQRNWPVFSKNSIAIGMAVTGPGGHIDAGTTVAAISQDGASITLNKAALVTTGPVTLTFDGTINITTCYLNSTTTVLSRDFRIMQGFRGYGDDKETNGSGGIDTDFMLETHPIDDGSLTTDKNYKRLAVDYDTDGPALTVMLVTAPDNVSTSVTAAITGASAIWGQPLWGQFQWGIPATTEWYTGLREGIFGTSYRLIMSARVNAGIVVKTAEVDADVMPHRRYS